MNLYIHLLLLVYYCLSYSFPCLIVSDNVLKYNFDFDIYFSPFWKHNHIGYKNIHDDELRNNLFSKHPFVLKYVNSKSKKYINDNEDCIGVLSVLRSYYKPFYYSKSNINGITVDSIISQENIQIKSKYVNISMPNILYNSANDQKQKIRCICNFNKMISQYTNLSIKLEEIFVKNGRLQLLFKKNQTGGTWSLNDLSSGEKIIFFCYFHFSTIWSFYTGTFLLLDEPEISLHPKLQSDYLKLCHSFMMDYQLFISSHSSYLISDIDSDTLVYIYENNTFTPLNNNQDRFLPYFSEAETNFRAFKIPSIDYFLHLYTELENKNWQQYKIYFKNSRFCKDKKWRKINKCGKINKQTLPFLICLRHKIHHPDNNLNEKLFKYGKYHSYKDHIYDGICFMQKLLKYIQTLTTN